MTLFFCLIFQSLIRSGKNKRDQFIILHDFLFIFPFVHPCFFEGIMHLILELIEMFLLLNLFQ